MIPWNDQSVHPPPSPLLILHPALASVASASHFLSLDPRSRAFAKAAGLKLFPEAL
jgi:hypothetical protein